MKKLIFIVLAAVALIGLSGCAGFERYNPNGVVEVSYNPETGAWTYRNTKNTSGEMVLPNGAKLKIKTDAAAGIEARAEAQRAQTEAFSATTDRLGEVLEALEGVKDILTTP